MANTEQAAQSADTPTADEFLETETGGRKLDGPVARLLLITAIAWSLFQLWIASPLPFLFDFGQVNSSQARSIHLAFATFLAFTSFPIMKGKHRHRVPVFDWILALAASFTAAYLFIFYRELSDRPGSPTMTDMVVAMAGLILLLEATRRSLGLPLAIVAAVFITYSLAGPYMPDVIAHGGVSIRKLASHQWLGTEGVFGVALGVSTSFVFLFVLFGAMLEKAGAGNYFIKVSYALLGHMRGGPAKAAVVSSGLSGMISGSSIANVVTTGTFTIPLMKKVGFPGTKAGAVEVAASTNGQLTPPVMGAAAFLMVEYVGISYLEVVKHAILPALISYVALVYIVHLEACKLRMHGIERLEKPTLAQRMVVWCSVLVGLFVLTLAVYYGIGWTRAFMGDNAAWVVGPVVLATYIGLVAYATRFPELDIEKATDAQELPPVGPTVKTGLYFLLPVVVLVWCLTVERFSPQLSALWATLFMIFIMVSHKPLKTFFRKSGDIISSTREGGADLIDALVRGAQNMIGIGVATAAAGIVVGTVTLTGIGLVMTEFVELISGGNLLLMLIFTAVISLILGMGLPTTANYIVVSTLMAPVIVTLGAENGLLVPLIAVHLFVFYFGILADDTPPVGLAAYAAAAISGADPIKTGIQGFTYDMRTAILPFMFIFNNQLLLIGLTGPLDLIITIVSATGAMLLFAAVTQGYWLTRSRWWETLFLLLITFTLFRPGFWWDRIYPPFEERPGSEIVEMVEKMPPGEELVLRASGETTSGRAKDTYMKMEIPDQGESGEERLQQLGLTLREDGDTMVVEQMEFGSQAEDAGLDFDWTIHSFQQPLDRPPREWMFVPALMLLALVAWNQRRRRTDEDRGIRPTTEQGTETSRASV